MPAKDSIHHSVKNALVKNGWTITHDPYTIQYGEDTLFADLAAERPFAAERAGQKIIVEIKSFIGRSVIQDFKVALGQYLLYRGPLIELAPEHKLYLAIGAMTYQNEFHRKIIDVAIKQNRIPLIIVDLRNEEVTQWIH